MGRNKYPEQTVQKILEVSRRLFFEKGYDQTSLQDIVKELEMTKGAIYHHFASKEDILNRLLEDYYSDITWFTSICDDTEKSGLEKLRQVFFHELGDLEKQEMDKISLSREIDPKLFLKELKGSTKEVAPLLVKLLEEGCIDGSLYTAYPKQVSEILLILLNVWANPNIFTVSEEEFKEKILFLDTLLSQHGVPILNKELQQKALLYFRSVTKKGKKQ